MRRTNDFYETPEHYVKELLARVPITGRILEPCAGDKAIARFFPGCFTNDIDPTRETDFNFDAAKSWPDDGFYYDWIVTNPPFNRAFDVWQQCMCRATYVALLLRISFFEPTKIRERHLLSTPANSLIYLPRYSFTHNGKSDMATVCWAIWGYHMNPPIQIARRFPA